MTKQKSSKRRDPAVTSRMMAAVKNKDSRAELLLRSALWRRGLRYRKHAKLTGRPDIVFGPARVAVFVDGDLWHGNAWRVRELPNLAALFPTRTDWWVNKIERNMARDRQVTERLRADGWVVLRFWESEVLKNTESVVDKIENEIKKRRDKLS